jgi:hypothetical protein
VADLLRGLGLCVALGLFIFVIAVFRGTQAQDQSWDTAATDSAVVAAIVTTIAITYSVLLWRKERRESAGPSEGSLLPGCNAGWSRGSDLFPPPSPLRAELSAT